MDLFRLKSVSDSFSIEVGEHLRRLHDDGFTVIRGGFAPGVLDAVLAGVKQKLSRNAGIFVKHLDADGHYPRIINLQALHAPLLRLFTENRLALAVQDAFFGEPSALYTSLYYERGSAQSIHRDTPYFSTRPEYRYLGVWVALEKADQSNGCLEVIRQGHLVPELDRVGIALQYYKTLDEIPSHALEGQDVLWDCYQAKVIEACRKRGLVPERVEAEAGDVVIWHPQLPHGGSQIQDISRTRHSFVMHVTPYRTPVYQQDVFFNPAKRVPEKMRSSSYRKFDGRYHLFFDEIDIGYRERRKVAEFAG